MTDSARQDARTAWLLREGDQLITAGGDRYTILDGAPGLGGSGVVYPARKNDDVLLYAVKECFPSGDSLFCWERRNGVIRPAAAFPGMENDLQMLLPQLRASYEQEKTASQEISNRTNRVVEIRDRLAVREVITNGQPYSVERGDFAPEEPLYLLMQYQTGRNGSAGRGMFLPEPPRPTFILPAGCCTFCLPGVPTKAALSSTFTVFPWQGSFLPQRSAARRTASGGWKS